MKKYLKLLRVIFITLCLSLALASCGAGNPNASSSSSQEFGTDSDGGDSQNLADNGWEASEGDDGSEYTATCDFSGEESDGDLVDCKIYWDAKNASNIPLDYSGYSYLVVDNSTFQTSDGYAELRTINPGSYAVKKVATTVLESPTVATLRRYSRLRALMNRIYWIFLSTSKLSATKSLGAPSASFHAQI